ncbi:hypothetical protein GCM10027355_11160 [Haloplanus salinarum]
MNPSSRSPAKVAFRYNIDLGHSGIDFDRVPYCIRLLNIVVRTITGYPEAQQKEYQITPKRVWSINTKIGAIGHRNIPFDRHELKTICKSHEATGVQRATWLLY